MCSIQKQFGHVARYKVCKITEEYVAQRVICYYLTVVAAESTPHTKVLKLGLNFVIN